MRQTKILTEEEAVNSGKVEMEKSPIYYAPNNFYCCCGHYLCVEKVSVELFYVILFCVNPGCSEQGTGKRVYFPVVEQYEVVGDLN